MAVPLLPELIPAPTNLIATPDRGWNRGSFGEIAGVAKNIAVPKDFPPSVFVDAIPDMWGKALTFGYALREASHQFHKPAVDAFRGFLTLLALRRRRKYSVTAVRVALPENQSSLPRFRSAAGRIMPTEKMSPQADWRQVNVILLDGEVVGITSPATLIAPREGLDMAAAFSRKLTNGYRFIDPTGTLTQEEAALVGRWVDDLNTAISAFAPQPGQTWLDDINRLLTAFSDELGDKAGTATPVYEVDANNLVLSGSIYTKLGIAVKERIAQPGMLELAADRAGVTPRLILYSDDADDQLKLPAHQISVTTDLPFSAVKGSPIGSDHGILGMYPLPNGTEWFRPEECLLPKLTVIRGKDAFVNVRGVSGIDEIKKLKEIVPLLPINETLTRYLTADTISKNSYFQLTNEGIVFGIRIPIDSGRRTLLATRLYANTSDDVCQIEQAELPVMEIWPKALIHTWKAYFTFWDRADVSALYFRPLRPIAATNPDPNDDPRYLTPVKEMEGSRMAREIHCLKSAPEFLLCEHIEELPATSTVRSTLGLVLPDYESSTNQAPTPVEVGFDFGTTNTNIFVRKATEQPKPLQLTTSTAQICRTEEKYREGALYRFFVPSPRPGGDSETAPFLSLLRIRPTVNTEDVLAPILQAHVCFYHFSGSGDQLADANLRADLKWEPDLNSERTAFLFQLGLQTAAEACRRGASQIRFRASYPSAYSAVMKGQMNGAWQYVTENLTRLTGVTCEFVDDLQTESVASAYYFMNFDAKRAALPGPGMVVADIGGGTSDISVWQSMDLRVQSSIRLSGTDILLEPMFRHRAAVIPKLCRVLPEVQRELLAEPLVAESDRTKFFRRADALLKIGGKKIVSDALMLLGGDPDFEILRSEIAVRLAGLFYYIGIMLRRAEWAQMQEGRLPNLFIGGNGCRLLHWLTPPRYDSKQEIHSLLTGAMAAGAQIDESKTPILLLEISKDPKSEASCGLLYVGKEVKLNIPPGTREAIVAGEAFTLNGQTQSATSILSAEMLSQDSGIVAGGAAEFCRFLALYNKFADRAESPVSSITNSDELIQRANDAIINYCQIQKRRTRDAVQREPLFVKAMVHSLYSAEWRSRSYGAHG